MKPEFDELNRQKAPSGLRVQIAGLKAQAEEYGDSHPYAGCRKDVALGWILRYN